MEVIVLIKTASKLSPPICRSGSTASLPKATLDRLYTRITGPLEYSSSFRKIAEKTVGLSFEFITTSIQVWVHCLPP